MCSSTVASPQSTRARLKKAAAPFQKHVLVPDGCSSIHGIQGPQGIAPEGDCAS